MRVSIQLKHILILLKENGPLTSTRLHYLLGLTPIKAEIASPDTDALITLASKLTIVKKIDNFYVLNFQIKNMNPSVLNLEEREKLVNLVINNKKIIMELRPFNLTDKFNYDSRNLLHRLLFELKIIDKNEQGYRVIKPFIVNKEHNIWKYSDDREQKEIGKFAEREIFNQEYEKLSRQPEFLAGLSHVSLTDDTLGYDIKSYDLDKKHEMYIEVKGTNNSEPYFLLTSNELETAKRLKKHYKITVVCGVNLEKRTYTKIIEIKNPSIELNKNYKITPDVFKVYPK